MHILRAASIFSGIWIAVESFTVMAAGFGIGPLVPMIANADGKADAHTRRFAACLAALLLLNLYAIAKERNLQVFHTVLVADALMISLCGVVEVFHGNAVAITWHVGLVLALGWLLVVKRKDWEEEGGNPKKS
mmetsp:Transcript_16410/g.18913  ORF Transcript_16410/g.18913 Transcript_16410/m.18913 type:complete len:133 (+) Transcript_16410:70-468(+)